jgi:hypothetical protein
MRAAVQSQLGGDLDSYLPKKRCGMSFQKSQPVETRHDCLLSASASSLKIWMHHSPHEKRTPKNYTKKLVTF